MPNATSTTTPAAAGPTYQYVPSTGDLNPNFNPPTPRDPPAASNRANPFNPDGTQNINYAPGFSLQTDANGHQTLVPNPPAPTPSQQNTASHQGNQDQTAAAREAAYADSVAAKNAVGQSRIDLNNQRAATLQAQNDFKIRAADLADKVASGKISHDDYVAQYTATHNEMTDASNQYKDQLSAFNDATTAYRNAADTAETIRSHQATEQETQQNNAAQRDLTAATNAGTFGQNYARDVMSFMGQHGDSPQWDQYVAQIANSKGAGPTPTAPTGFTIDPGQLVTNGLAFALANQSQAARDHITNTFPGSSPNPYLAPSANPNPAAAAQTTGAIAGPAVAPGGPATPTDPPVPGTPGPFIAPACGTTPAPTSPPIDTSSALNLTDTSDDTSAGLRALQAGNLRTGFVAPSAPPALCGTCQPN